MVTWAVSVRLICERRMRMGWWARSIDEVPEAQLDDLKQDVGETPNFAAEHPEIARWLMVAIENARQILRRKTQATGYRRVQHPAR